MKKFFISLLAAGTLALVPHAFAAVPQYQHVILVIEENHGYSQVIGNSAMPFLNQLANQYGLATQFYANTHPSIGNYFEMTAGQIITNDDSFSGVVSEDNLVRHINQAGLSWKSYAESLPQTGFTGGDTGVYSKRHNPFSFFSDVVNSAQKNNLVPFSQFAADMRSGNLPNFSFVAPNINDDAHNCPAGMDSCTDNDKLAVADKWLSDNIGPVLANSALMKNTLLLVAFDEAADSDSSHGGGRIAAVVAGANIKPGFQSSTFYQHQNLLKLVASALAIDPNIGDAGAASDMGEFFNPAATLPQSPQNQAPVSWDPATIRLPFGDR